MEEYRAPDFTRDPAPPPERPQGHIGYILLALIVMLLLWGWT